MPAKSASRTRPDTAPPAARRGAAGRARKESAAIAGPAAPEEEIQLAPELAEAVGFRVRKAGVIADALFARTFASLDFSTQQYAILLTVRHNPGCRPSQLSALLKISPNNLVPPIDNLVNRGFLKRSLGTKDRRIRHLWLTPAGERCVVELVQRHEAIRARVVARMGVDNMRELVRLLEIYTDMDVPDGDD